MLQYTTKLEKSEKVQKTTKRRIPPEGWGVGSKEHTRNCFLLLGYNALEKCTLVLVIWDPKAYKKREIETWK